MSGRYIDDEIAEKQVECDALQREVETLIKSYGQQNATLARLEKCQRELEELKRQRATGRYPRRGDE
jgi:uncharacterized protein involved in exopolysaccharide biosynthesis